MDGRDPGDRRRAQPSIGRRALGPPPVDGRIEVTTRGREPTARTPPSPSRSRRGRDHHPRRHPRHHPRPHPARPRRRPAETPATAGHQRGRAPAPRRPATRAGTRRSEAPPASARSHHRPTPEETSRPGSPPSSMTAVSRRPRPTSSSRESRSTSRGRREARRRARQLGVPPAPAPTFESDRRRDRRLRPRRGGAVLSVTWRDLDEPGAPRGRAPGVRALVQPLDDHRLAHAAGGAHGLEADGRRRACRGR